VARARILKPAFFANDKLAECEPLARILFQGLWCVADREGRLEDRPKRLRAEILPYDDCDVSALLGQLEARGFVRRYSVNGENYIEVVNFAKHQKPHHLEAKSEIPSSSDDAATSSRDQGEITPTSSRDHHEVEVTSSALTLNLSPLTLNPSGCVVSAPASKSAAVGVIQLFDEARVDAFGEEFRRPWPTSADSTFAERWLAAGADFDLCQGVFREGFGAAKARGRPPPGSLSYFDKPVANALAEKRRPMAEGTANGTTSKIQRLGPASGIAQGFADALSQLQRDEDSGRDQPAPRALLGRQ
jgi:hypothetical protein